jgi:glutamate/tyrosine decarboxylase-like PLP-dependent enzyme
MLGLGTRCIEAVEVDEHGAMRPDALAKQTGARPGPMIVCAQAGNVNTGAVDPLEEICAVGHAAGAWVHIDGAFGLWAAASPRHRARLAGCEKADSWATDGHKWLNVPYDCGMAFVADAEAHRASMRVSASYLQQGEAVREPMDWTPEFSRRSRSLPVYAAIRSLGRSGVAELVERLCECAQRFATALEAAPGIAVLSNGLNQVLVRVHDDAETTDQIVQELQRDGTCWMSATTWRGQRCVRISVCNWQTTFDDVDRSTAALVRVRDRVLRTGI